MKFYNFLKQYDTEKVLKIITHSSDDEKFTIYSDAVDMLAYDIKQSEVAKWKINGNQTVEVWLEKAIPSG